MVVAMVVVVVVVVFGLEAGEEKRLHIGNDSQEMPQDHDYKNFLRNNWIRHISTDDWTNSWSERYNA